MVRLSEDPEYGFAIGRVRALEPALLDRARYERLVRTHGCEEFAAALNETASAMFLDGRSGDLTHAFEVAAERNFAFLSLYALDSWLVHLFRIPLATRGLKVALKDALSRGGADVAAPAGLVETGQRSTVDRTVAEVVEAYAENEDPTAVDSAVDRMTQELQLRAAAPSQFVTGYLCLHADVENLRTLARSKALPSGGEDGRREIEAAFLSGGRLALGDLVAALPEPWATVVELLGRSRPYGAGDDAFREYLEQGRLAAADGRSYARMERTGRELELRYLRQSRYATFGHEPLVTFYLLRENEVRNLRLLYAAKLAGSADEEMKDLVAYVE